MNRERFRGNPWENPQPGSVLDLHQRIMQLRSVVAHSGFILTPAQMGEGRGVANRVANATAAGIRANSSEFRQTVIAGHRDGFMQQHGRTPTRVYLTARSLYDTVASWQSIALTQTPAGNSVEFIALADFALGVRCTSEPLIQVEDYLQSTDEEQRERLRQMYQVMTGSSDEARVDTDLARTQGFVQNTIDWLRQDSSGARFVEECVRQITKGVKSGQKESVVPFAIDDVHAYRAMAGIQVTIVQQ